MVTNHASAIIIDDYIDGSIIVESLDLSPGVTELQAGLDSATVVGGTRSLYAGTLSPVTTGAKIQIETVKNRFHFWSDPNQFGYFDVTYGSESHLGLDLIGAGDDRFVISYVDTSALWRGGYAISIYTGDPVAPVRSTHDFSEVFFAHLQDASYGELVIPFSVFSGDPDLTRVQKIQINGSRVEPGAHIGFESIVSAPEPSAISLFAAGLLVAANRCRKTIL